MATTRTLTEFLQHSGTILPEVERGEVVLRRRSGDEIVLIAEQHLRALEASLLVLAEAYRAGQLGGRQEQPRREWFALPWMSLLPLDDQRACLDELTATALAETLAEWRATALATWDADRQRDREYDLDEPLPLERP